MTHRRTGVDTNPIPPSPRPAPMVQNPRAIRSIFFFNLFPEAQTSCAGKILAVEPHLRTWCPVSQSVLFCIFLAFSRKCCRGCSVELRPSPPPPRRTCAGAWPWCSRRRPARTCQASSSRSSRGTGVPSCRSVPTARTWWSFGRCSFHKTPAVYVRPTREQVVSRKLLLLKTQLTLLPHRPALCIHWGSFVLSVFYSELFCQQQFKRSVSPPPHARTTTKTGHALSNYLRVYVDHGRHAGAPVTGDRRPGARVLGHARRAAHQDRGRWGGGRGNGTAEPRPRGVRAARLQVGFSHGVARDVSGRFVSFFSDGVRGCLAFVV